MHSIRFWLETLLIARRNSVCSEHPWLVDGFLQNLDGESISSDQVQYMLLEPASIA